MNMLAVRDENRLCFFVGAFTPFTTQNKNVCSKSYIMINFTFLSPFLFSPFLSRTNKRN